MVDNPAVVAIKKPDHVEQSVSVQLGQLEMGPLVDRTVIWMDILMRN